MRDTTEPLRQSLLHECDVCHQEVPWDQEWQENVGKYIRGHRGCAVAEAGNWALIEVERLEAVFRLLIDSGDMTPMAAGQIRVTTGIESAVEAS